MSEDDKALKQKRLLAEAIHAKRKREAQDDFWAFCVYIDPKFFAKRTFMEEVAGAFMRVYEAFRDGKTRRLAVSMPPRAGKSYTSSLFIAWMLGKYPEHSVMRNCVSDTLYNKLSYDTRNIVRGGKYREVFPDVKLAADKQNVKGWNLSTSTQVGYFGAGVGGTIIGFGASMLAMTDDLYKSLEDALSDTNNEKIWSWKQGTHDSRLEGNCCSIDIGTRWSEQDIIGRLEGAGKYDEVVRIAALDENDESFCEDVHSTEYYHELREDLDSSIWEAEYMQNPIEAKGLLFGRSELQRFRMKDIKDIKPDGVIASCDVADMGDDDFAAPFARVINDKLYVVDVVFTKDPVEITEPRLVQAIKDNNCDQIRIESNNGGRIFGRNVRNGLRELKHKAVVQTKHTTKNKETRILMKSGWVKNNCVFLDERDYERGSDYDRFIRNLTNYKKMGGNKHDDAPDSMTILAEFADDLNLRRAMKARRVDTRVVGV